MKRPEAFDLRQARRLTIPKYWRTLTNNPAGLREYYRVSESPADYGKLTITTGQLEGITQGTTRMIRLGMSEGALINLQTEEALLMMGLTSCTGFGMRLQEPGLPQDLFLTVHTPIEQAEIFEELLGIVKNNNFTVKDFMISTQEPNSYQERIAAAYPQASFWGDTRGSKEFGGILITPTYGALLRENNYGTQYTYKPFKIRDWDKTLDVEERADDPRIQAHCV